MNEEYIKYKRGKAIKSLKEGKAIIAYLLIGVNIQLFILIRMLSNVAS